jgi:hypothetical protein
VSELESAVQKRVQVTATSCGARLLRNNVGALPNENGRLVRFGLAEGSADLIGWCSVVIGPEHIGRKLAVFLSVETKRPAGRTAKARLEKQKNWRDAINAAGGIAFFCDNEQALAAELEKILK